MTPSRIQRLQPEASPLECPRFWQLPPPAHRSPAERKVLPMESLLSAVEAERSAGRTVAIASGAFDVLHVGHTRCLEEAASLADLLVVGVYSDACVRRLKGSCRPVIGQRDRSRVLAALAAVDYVVIVDEPAVRLLVDRVRPAVYVESVHDRQIDVRRLVVAHSGRVHRVTELPGISTSRVMQRIAASADAGRDEPRKQLDENP